MTNIKELAQRVANEKEWGIDTFDPDFDADIVSFATRFLAAYLAEQEPVFIVFDGPPNHNSGRFVEVETADGKSVGCRDFPWTEHGDYWHLGPFYTAPPLPEPTPQQEPVA